MIGLVLVTHGQLAEEFRRAVEHVVGPQENFETVSIGADDDMEQRRRDIVDAVTRAEARELVTVEPWVDGRVLRIQENAGYGAVTEPLEAL